MDPEIIKKLKRLPNGGELVVEGETWTKFSLDREFKVSPHGEKGDFDTDCRFVAYEDLV